MSKISVIMPVYNGEKYMGEAIASILGQTEKDIEFIIVDDGSTDGTESIIKSFKDARVKYFKRPHEGVISALNFALSKASSKYVARMDADDIAYPERLEKQLRYMIDHKLVLCGSWVDLIAEDGSHIGELRYPSVEARPIRIYAIFHNPFIHPTVMYEKDKILRAGAYRNYKHAEDYELWTRIIYRYNVGNIPEKLIQYRLHSLQVTKKNNRLMRGSAYVVRFHAFFRYGLRFIGIRL